MKTDKPTRPPTPADPAATPKYRLRRKPPKVRPHASGALTVCIGKSLSDDKSRLRPTDHYFRMTETAANSEAARIDRRWKHIVRHWSTLYQPTLTALKMPFADIPHWQEHLIQTTAPTADEIKAFQDRPRSADEIDEAYGPIEVNGELVEKGITLNGVYALYKTKLEADSADSENEVSTAWTDLKNLRCSMAFFDGEMHMTAFNADSIKIAKAKMKLKPRTRTNYLSMVKRMLVWFYESPYGRMYRDDKLTTDEWKKSTSVRKSKSQVRMYDFAELKTLLSSATDEQRLYTMLALNSGMTQADIGRLTFSEINLVEGYVFWDREKQPDNDFRVRHDLWPETLRLVRKFMQATNAKRHFFTDYRTKPPVEVDCSTLVFVNPKGEPLYRVRPSGKASDLLGKIFSKNTATDSDGKAFHFMNLRKSTNQILKDHLRDKAEGETSGQILAITEISETFLSHGSPALQALYEAKGVKAYGLMNKWLAEVGNLMRTNKVFESLK